MWCVSTMCIFWQSCQTLRKMCECFGRKLNLTLQRITSKLYDMKMSQFVLNGEEIDQCNSVQHILVGILVKTKAD